MIDIKNIYQRKIKSATLVASFWREWPETVFHMIILLVYSLYYIAILVLGPKEQLKFNMFLF